MARASKTLFTPGWVVAIFLLLASWAYGAPAEPAPKTQVSLFLFKPADQTEFSAAISNALLKALRANRRLRVKDSDKLLVEFAGEVPGEDIAIAEELQSQAKELTAKGHAKAAVTPLRQSIAKMESLMAFIKKRKLAAAHMALGVAEASAGLKRDAARTFTRLLTWRTKLRYNTAIHPPVHLPLFEKARKKLSKKKKGSIELLSKPPGAKAYVDGRFVGVTPTVAYGLLSGAHYATFKMAGYVKAAAKVTVSDREQSTHTQALKRSQKYLLLQQSLAGARAALAKKVATSDIVDLRSILFIDQALFATVTPKPNQKVKVDAYLFDLRSKLRLSLASVSVSKENLQPLRDLARNLYLNVRYDGAVDTPPDPPPPPKIEKTPIYAKWWFWTAIGVGVAGAVIFPTLFWPEDTSCAKGRSCIQVHN
jgi:hypothetical protein